MKRAGFVLLLLMILILSFCSIPAVAMSALMEMLYGVDENTTLICEKGEKVEINWTLEAASRDTLVFLIENIFSVFEEFVLNINRTSGANNKDTYSIQVIFPLTCLPQSSPQEDSQKSDLLNIVQPSYVPSMEGLYITGVAVSLAMFLIWPLPSSIVVLIIIILLSVACCLIIRFFQVRNSPTYHPV